MNKKNHLMKNKHILAVLIIACICLIAATASSLLPVAPVRSVFQTIVSPLQNGISRAGSFLAGQQSARKSTEELTQENQQLQSRVAQLEEQNTLLTEDTQELEKLQTLYKLDKSYADYDKVAAQVIASESGSWFSSFTINRGSSDGIETGMNVLADGGLVGIVTETGRHWATVRSIIDDSNNVSATILSTQDNCIVSGSLDLIRQNKMELSELVTDNDVVAGSKVVTSYISDKYLPGILIGYVDTIEEDANHLQKTGTVIPAVDFRHITDVLVIQTTKRTADTESKGGQADAGNAAESVSSTSGAASDSRVSAQSGTEGNP